MERTPKPGEIYQHFKGNLYRIVTLAEHTESGERLVVYQALYGDFAVYARPLEQFLSKVDREKYPQAQAVYRFTLIPEVGAVQASPAMQPVPQEGPCGGALISGTREAAAGGKEPFREEGRTAAKAGQPAPTKVSGSGSAGAAVPEPGRADEGVQEEEAFALDPGLLAFLDADSYEKKLEVFAALRNRADESMLNTIAVSLDLELSKGSLEEQYETLRNCLLTLEKYECNRLR